MGLDGDATVKQQEIITSMEREGLKYVSGGVEALRHSCPMWDLLLLDYTHWTESTILSAINLEMSDGRLRQSKPEIVGTLSKYLTKIKQSHSPNFVNHSDLITALYNGDWEQDGN